MAAGSTVRWLAGAVLASAVLCTAAPATADSQAHHDPRGDVTDAFGGSIARPAGIDIVRLRNTYEGNRLTVSMTSVNLPRTDWGAYWTIRTGPDTGYGLYYEERGPKTWLYFGRALIGPPGARGRSSPLPTKCKAARAEVVGDTVTASVPRRCIDDKRRVRISGTVQNNDRQRELVDDSRRRGQDLTEPNDEFGPFLYRG